MLSQSIMFRYIRLVPGAKAEKEIEIGLPLASTSPFSHGTLGTDVIRKIEQVQLYVGYFDIDLSSSSNTMIKAVSDDEVYMDYFWTGKAQEKTLAVLYDINSR